MPQLDLDDGRERLLRAGATVERGAVRLWKGFTGFALQDNVLEVAVGLILAAAFTTLVTSFVSDIILPPLSMVPFIDRNLEAKFAILRKGSHYDQAGGYNTTQQAIDDGAVIMAYGAFINKCINFIGVGIGLYSIANLYEWLSKDTIIKPTVKCKYCRKKISEKARRCFNCTSWVDGREDRPHH